MVFAIVLAGGKGLRMGEKTNKVLLPLLGMPVIARSVRAFVGLADGIVVVSREDEMETIADMMKQYRLPVFAYVKGGFDRQDSVKNGLMALPEACTQVLVHDGARPLVTREVIERVMDSVSAFGSGVAAIPVTDTLKAVDENECVQKTLDRTVLRAMQTPQGFQKALLIKAHQAAEQKGLRGTDEAEIVALTGAEIRLTPGDKANIKLTQRGDMVMAQAILNSRGEHGEPMLRVGQGYDVHRLARGRKLVLCGETIAHPTGLLGHSDADVALHALMDAMLGAAGMHDIGRHFPDTDEKYLGISSMALLASVAKKIAARGYRVSNADITIIAQAPKLLPYIDKMILNVAGVLGLNPEYINIKATTTEHMGFEGEEKGISAMAVCMLEKKDKEREV